ncbi:MAG: hypothetical protein WBB00_02185 [Mycobacterium sp.]
MYLTAERLAIANQAIMETFENTSIAWQAIPHWDTGDPGQTRVRDDIITTPPNPGFLNIELEQVSFEVTLFQTSAPTPESLTTEIIMATTTLAKQFDDKVLAELRAKVPATKDFSAGNAQGLLDNLIEARATVEDAGYRAPSCLITNTLGLKYLSELSSGYPITEALLGAANVNSLHRTSILDEAVQAVDAAGALKVDGGGKAIMEPGAVLLMIGRRQRIAHGAAPDASPGEEPVDIAVSVPPSLEVVGEAPNSELALSVRVRFATRVKAMDALVERRVATVVP